MTVSDREVLLGLESFGDAVYFVDRAAFVANVERFRAAFQRAYARANLGYSVKTNYLPYFCRQAHALGCYSEVVSEMEYALVRALGVPGDRIIVNGPYKSAAFLRRALDEGAIVNLDAAYEIAALEELAADGDRSKRPWRLGLRCNVEIGGARVSRFGFDAEGGNLRASAERLRRLPGAELVALHSHVCTRARSVAEYEELADKLIALADDLFGDRGPEMINLGGGFFSEMPEGMRATFGAEIPTFDEYGSALGAKMAKRYGAGGPELVLEPGLAILATAMHFACEVIDIKKLGDRTFVSTSGSIYNIKPTKSRRKLPMRVIHRERAPVVECRGADLAGYTCMEDDILHEGFDGPIAVGDVIVFDNVGAYTVVLKPPFIKTCPPVVGYDEASGAFFVVKREEADSDVFATFAMDGGVLR
ncbi:MAG: alanine racemase [Labilithrix sp.]|nr:alanine racemase [Labilithrix sp.]